MCPLLKAAEERFAAARAAVLQLHYVGDVRLETEFASAMDALKRARHAAEWGS